MVTTDRTQSTRDALIDAAIDAFRRNGAHGASIGSICAAAGVGKGVFAHHFPGGKRELQMAVIERNGEAFDAVLADLVETGAGPAGTIEACFEFYANALESDPGFACPIAATVVDLHDDEPAVVALADASFRRWESRLRELLEDHETADDLATSIVAGFEGAILLAVARRDPSVLSRTGRVLARLVAT